MLIKKINNNLFEITCRCGNILTVEKDRTYVCIKCRVILGYSPSLKKDLERYKKTRDENDKEKIFARINRLQNKEILDSIRYASRFIN